MERLGIVLYHGIDSGEELRRYGELAENAGFDSLWVTERYFHEETFSLLGYLAAATNTIKLGLGVTNPYTRNPALLAMSTATLDRISGGRFSLGLGRSERGVIQGRMGMRYGDPFQVMESVVSTLRRLMAGEALTTTEGPSPLTNVRLAIAPSQAEPPIYLAAIGPKALRLAGAIADGVLLNAYTPVSYVKYAAEEVRKAATEGRARPRFGGYCLHVDHAADRRAGAALARPEAPDRSPVGRTPRRRDSAGEGRVRSVHPGAAAGIGATGQGRKRGRPYQRRHGGRLLSCGAGRILQGTGCGLPRCRRGLAVAAAPGWKTSRTSPGPTANKQQINRKESRP